VRARAAAAEAPSARQTTETVGRVRAAAAGRQADSTFDYRVRKLEREEWVATGHVMHAEERWAREALAEPRPRQLVHRGERERTDDVPYDLLTGHVVEEQPGTRSRAAHPSEPWR
jgi:hypothetical protein